MERSSIIFDEPLTPDDIEEGTRDKPASLSCCRSNGRFICTRYQHHIGPHVAALSDGNVIAIWKDVN